MADGKLQQAYPDGGESEFLIDGKRKRSLRFSVWDACFYASQVGIGETYFVPLLLAMGGTSYHAGIFTSIPQLCMSFAQFLSIFLIERLMVRKRIIVGATFVQAVLIMSILAGVLTGKLHPWVFIILACGYFAANSIAIPAWNSLMGDYTTPDNRGQYFGRRNGLSQLITFLGVVAGGVILQHFHDLKLTLTGFAIIIALTLASRLGSITMLIKHFELPYRKVEGSYFSFFQFVRKSPKSNFAHFVYFQAMINFATQISSPFFIIYMLRDLGFSYIQYMIAQGTFVAIHFIAMRRWGPFADRYGNRIVLKMTAFMLPVLPILWLGSRHFWFIMIVQIVSGLTWGGWTLCSSNFIYDAVTPTKRARCAAYSNFFNSMGIFAGALIGALLSTRLPHSMGIGAVKLTLFSPLEFLFLFSGLLRFAISAIFMRTVREVRPVSKPKVSEMLMMLTHIGPLSGPSHEPYTAADVHDKGIAPDDPNQF